MILSHCGLDSLFIIPFIQASFEDDGSETSEMAIQSTLNILFSFIKNIFNGINRLAPETLFYLDDVLPMNTHIFTFVPIHICNVCMKKQKNKSYPVKIVGVFLM